MKNDPNDRLEKYSDAISHIDDDILEAALTQRKSLLDSRQSVQSTTKLRRLGWISILAACLALAVSIPAFALALSRSDRPAEPAVSGAEPTVTTDSGTKVTTSSQPQYVPAFDEPTLEEIYQIEPYNQFTPRSGFDKLKFTSSYQRVPDEVLGDVLYLDVRFGLPSDTSESLIIRIQAYDGWKIEDIYDPERNYISTYKLIPVKYLTPEVVEQLYYNLNDPAKEYRHWFDLFLLCEYQGKKYQIQYEYSGNGFTPEMLYNLITSADYFTNTSTD